MQCSADLRIGVILKISNVHEEINEIGRFARSGLSVVFEVSDPSAMTVPVKRQSNRD